MQSNFHYQRPKENHLCQQIPRWIDDFDQTNYAKDVVNRTAQRSICICNNINMNVGWKWDVNVSISVASSKPLTLRQEQALSSKLKTNLQTTAAPTESGTLKENFCQALRRL